MFMVINQKTAIQLSLSISIFKQAKAIKNGKILALYTGHLAPRTAANLG